MLDVRIVGIDFGTSNSTVGYPTEFGPQLIKIEGDHLNIPSAIFYNLENPPIIPLKNLVQTEIADKKKEITTASKSSKSSKNSKKKLQSDQKAVMPDAKPIFQSNPREKYKIQFGREAINAYINHSEGRLLRSLKSILGSSLINESTQIGYEQISFKEIIGKFIKHLKKKTEDHLCSEIEFVVIGRPVWFVDEDPDADRLAQDQLESIVLDCGFKCVFFQYEPIAAALDYEQRITREELALIIDIGGGTSDFSIVRVSPTQHLKSDRKLDILANTGVHIGGTDLDRQLSIGQFMQHLGYKTRQRIRSELELPVSCFYDLATWYKIALLYNQKTMLILKELHSIAEKPDLINRFIKVIHEKNGHRLAGDIEMGKILLSDKESIDLNMDYIEKELTVSLTRKSFEENIVREREQIVNSIQKCLKEAQVTTEEINTIFLTGGTTAIPSILSSCKSLIPNARLVEGDRFGSVGTGLAIHAGILSESIYYLI